MLAFSLVLNISFRFRWICFLNAIIESRDLSMLGFVLLAVVFSPLLPMIFLFYIYFQSGADRVLISLMMLAVCVLSLFLGEMYERHSSGFDGMRAIGAIWGGFAGIILSLIVLAVSFFIRLSIAKEMSG